MNALYIGQYIYVVRDLRSPVTGFPLYYPRNSEAVTIETEAEEEITIRVHRPIRGLASRITAQEPA